MTVADALKHPTWDMGAKITIDSSTLMNKGLEVIEAHELFGVDFDRIDVVVHPQSIVHGMVEFVDGATIAQLSMPDMRLPIGLALGAPDRLPEPFGAIDWTELSQLTFEPPDLDDLPLPARSPTRRAGRGAAPGDAQRGQRGRGRGLPRRAHPVDRNRRRSNEAVLNRGAGNADEVADVLDADRVARERARRPSEPSNEEALREGPVRGSPGRRFTAGGERRSSRCCSAASSFSPWWCPGAGRP